MHGVNYTIQLFGLHIDLTLHTSVLHLLVCTMIFELNNNWRTRICHIYFSFIALKINYRRENLKLMRRWVLPCALFLLGWLAGCTFVLMWVIDPATTSALRGVGIHGDFASYPASHKSTYLQKDVRMFSATAHMLKQRSGVLPDWPPLPVNHTTHFPFIFNWRYDARLFSIYNYKVLESVLAQYPAARVVVHHPTVVDTCDAPLSAFQFSKYKKMGYDITFSSVDDESYRLRSAYGGAFWTRWMQAGCVIENCSSPIPAALLDKIQKGLTRQPYFAEIYQHIAGLWKTGGIYNDFSFYFLGHLEAQNAINEEGSFISATCGQRRVTHSLPRDCNAPARKVHPPSVPVFQHSSGSGMKSRAQLHLGSSGGHYHQAGADRMDRSRLGMQCDISTALLFRQVRTCLSFIYHIDHIY